MRADVLKIKNHISWTIALTVLRLVSLQPYCRSRTSAKPVVKGYKMTEKPKEAMEPSKPRKRNESLIQYCEFLAEQEKLKVREIAAYKAELTSSSPCGSKKSPSSVASAK